MHEIKAIMKEVYDHKMDGVIFHSDMITAFDFLGLKGFKKWQENQCEEEVESTNDIQHHFIKHHKMMLEPYQGHYESGVIPSEWYSASKMDISSADIEKHTKRLLQMYHKWEKDTAEFLKMKSKELIEHEAYSEYIELREMCEDVHKEIYFIEDFCVELESVNYDCKYIMKVQERFCLEFG